MRLQHFSRRGPSLRPALSGTRSVSAKRHNVMRRKQETRENKMTATAKLAAIAFGLATCMSGAASAAWQPAKPIEFIATAGPGGGTDNFARAVQSIITKHKLIEQPIVVTNKGGGSGAEG